MSAPLQIPLRRPLVSVETARVALDQSEDDILAMIQDGRLRFAFDLSANKSRRSLVRILAASLVDHIYGTDQQPAELLEAVMGVFPGTTDTVRAANLTRAMNTGRSHITTLINQRCLKKVKNGNFLKDSPLISRESAIAWLASRRLPA